MHDMDSLRRCLRSLERNSNDKVVIVPGGGLFADHIRLLQKQCEFDDKTAHQMSILAMQQMALLYKSICNTMVLAKTVSSIKQALHTHAVVIWLPDIDELNMSGIKASWDVTSDSLAAWLTNQLTAEQLILVKSAEIPATVNIQNMQDLGILDRAFSEFSKDSDYNIKIINKHCLNEYSSI